MRYAVLAALLVGITSAAPQPTRVPGSKQEKKLVQREKPVYPPEAKAAGISGPVKLTVRIAADGSVADVTLISGHEMLAPSAIDAVSKWKYEPTLVNGEAVEVVTDVVVNYQLKDQKAKPKK